MTKIKPLRLAGMPRLYKGASEDPADGACIMQYVSLIRYNRFDDQPRCVNVAVRDISIAVNDTSWDDEREDRLMPLVHRLMNTQGLTNKQRKLLDRWRRAAHNAASESRQRVYDEWVREGRHYALACGCRMKDCRYTPFDRATDAAASEIYYSCLLRMLDHIAAWKRFSPAEVTAEEWESWDQLRQQYAHAGIA
jgi:hypothetical protein